MEYLVIFSVFFLILCQGVSIAEIRKSNYLNKQIVESLKKMGDYQEYLHNKSIKSALNRENKS